MSLKYIFEDKLIADNRDKDSSKDKYIPISFLLKSCYNKNNIYFSEGNMLLSGKLRRIYNTTDIFIIFIDTIPNNNSTIGLYRKLVERYEEKSNVYVIPILGIEYFVVNCLVNYSYIERSKLLDELLLKGELNLTKARFNKNATELNLEKVFKELIKTEGLKCMRNETKRTKNEVDSYKSEDFLDNDLGSFYLRDCCCSDCSIECTDSLALKAERLYSELPVIEIVDDKHESLMKKYSINLVDTDIECAVKEYIEIYNKYAKKLGAEEI